LVELTHGRLRASRGSLVEALRGRVREHHRFLLRLHLAQVDALNAAIQKIENRVGRTLDPIRERAQLLTSIPGVSDTVANVIVAEIGIDMTRFPSAGHLVSWAGLCPRNDESAGKRRSTRLRKGAPWLKTTIVQAAWGAAKTKNSYLRAQFLRIKSRRGPMKAIVAVAASMLTAIYHMLRTGQPYHDLTGAFFDSRDRTRLAKRLLRRLADLGFQCQVAAPT